MAAPTQTNQGTPVVMHGTTPTNQGAPVVMQGPTPTNQGTPVVMHGPTPTNQGTPVVMHGPTPTNQGSPVVMQGPTPQGGIPMMIQGTPTQMNQQQFFCIPGNQKAFPVRSLKIFGGIQIVLGILLGLLSVIGVGLDAVAMNTKCNQNSYNFGVYWSCYARPHSLHSLFAFDITCLVCSGWYIMTGVLPICMNEKRENSWRGIRVAFMVCSIIGASVFVPIMFSRNVVGSIMRAAYTYNTIVLSALMVVLSFIQLVVAIVASSFCCCCTPWQSQQQTQQLVFMSATQPGTFVNLPQTQIPVMNYQTTTMTAAGGQGYPQDSRAQQYVITTNQQQLQQNMNNKLEPTNVTATSPESPPSYKE